LSFSPYFTSSCFFVLLRCFFFCSLGFFFFPMFLHLPHPKVGFFPENSSFPFSFVWGTQVYWACRFGALRRLSAFVPAHSPLFQAYRADVSPNHSFFLDDSCCLHVLTRAFTFSFALDLRRIPDRSARTPFPRPHRRHSANKLVLGGKRTFSGPDILCC